MTHFIPKVVQVPSSEKVSLIPAGSWPECGMYIAAALARGSRIAPQQLGTVAGHSGLTQMALKLYSSTGHLSTLQSLRHTLHPEAPRFSTLC